MHEEGLHRIEEERHDYDFNIEALARTVQLLDPIAQQLQVKPLEERMKFQLPAGLGGQSETIYKRVIMKLYGRERGKMVIEALFAQPWNVVPTLLTRLKMKLEEYKAAQVSTSANALVGSSSLLYSANGRKSGVTKHRRSSGRVWIIKASTPSNRTNVNFNPRPCRTRSKSSTRSRSANGSSSRSKSRNGSSITSSRIPMSC